MKFLSTTITLVTLNGFALAQQIRLSGQISIHNSKYNTGKIEYVKSAYVTAPFTKPACSDDSGQFMLEFVGIEAGTAVKIQVEKPGLEVVNDYELQHIVIGAKSPLRIYLISKGELAAAQTELYNISKSAFLARKDAIIKKLRASEEESKMAIDELKKRFGQAITDRYMAEELLNDKVQAVEKRLPEFAQHMATQNLDFASELYIEAYEQFKNGNIEKVIEILDTVKLNKSYQDVMKHYLVGQRLQVIGKDIQEKGQLQLRQIIDSYQLKAEAFNLLFKYANVAQLYENLIEKNKNNQVDKLELANWYTKAACAYYDNGQIEKALLYYQNAIGIKKEILNRKHPDLAVSYSSIALAYHALGKYTTAFEYEKEALRIQRKVLNSKHMNLATSYNHMALTYHALARYDEALKYWQKAINIRKKTLHPMHPDLAICYCNIALTYNALAMYKTALKYNHKAVSILEQMNNPKYPDLAASYNSMAITYNALGKGDTALIYEQKAIHMMERILHPDHPDLATVYDNMGTTCQTLGQYTRALEYQEKSVRIREAIFDSLHPSLAASYMNIALTYQALRKYNVALEYQEKGIHVQEKIFESNHPQLAISYRISSTTYQALNDNKKALERVEKAIKIQENSNIKHPDLATSYTTRAFIYYQQDNKNYALEDAEKAIAMQEKLLGHNHPNLAISYNNIALIQEAFKNHKSAVNYQQKSVAIWKSISPEHPYLASCYAQMATAYNSLKQYVEAYECQRKSILIQEKVLDREHPDLITSYTNMAVIFQNLNMHETALLYYQKVFSRLAGRDSMYLNMAICYTKTAAIYQYLNQYDTALYYYQKSIAILENDSNSENKDLLASYINTAIIYMLKGKYEIALAYQHKSICLREEISDFESPHLRRAEYDYSIAVTKNSFYTKKNLMDSLVRIYYSNDFNTWAKKKHSVVLTDSAKVACYWYYIGFCNFYLQNYQAAIEAYTKAENLSPEIKKRYYYNNIGMAYAKTNQFSKTYAVFLAQEKDNPGEIDSYVNWCMYYTFLKEKEKAKVNLQKAFELCRNDSKKINANPRLKIILHDPIYKTIIKDLEDGKIDMK